MLTEQLFESREDASAAAADHIADCLKKTLGKYDRTTVVLSGGSTPAQCFDLLSRKALDWSRVQLAMTDERWVPNDHPDSNEKMLRDSLQQHRAAAASVLSIYQGDLSVDERCDSLQKQLPKNNFACSLLGMGADGHFASLFPDGDNVEIGLDRKSTRFYLPVRTAASPHPRVSMTLAALLKSDEVFILMFGNEKRAVFERARAGDQSLPIAALLEQKDVPLTLYWAP